MLRVSPLLTLFMTFALLLAACAPATPSVQGTSATATTKADESLVIRQTAPAAQPPADATSTTAPTSTTAAATATTEATATTAATATREATATSRATAEATAQATGQATAAATQGAGTEACTDASLTQAGLAESGEETYAASCAACHGAEGEGQGTFPALTGNEEVIDDDPEDMLEDFFEVPAHQTLVEGLEDEELAGVFTFIRGAWGNEAGMICPEFAAEVRDRP